MQYATTPGLWTVSNPRLVSGRLFDDSLVSERVAVIGMNASRSRGISNLSEPAVIFLNGIRFSVIGISSKSQGLSAPLSSITIPANVAKNTSEL
jgi:putative ABC transport system permease protein